MATKSTKYTGRKKIKVPLSLLVDIGTLLYASVSVFHPDWLIISNFRLRRSGNLHNDSSQNSWIYTRVKTGNFYRDECLGSPSHTGYGPATRHNQRSLSWVWSNCIFCVLEYTPLNGFYWLTLLRYNGHSSLTCAQTLHVEQLDSPYT